MSDTSQGVGWWQASDGKWYPPQSLASPSRLRNCPACGHVIHPDALRCTNCGKRQRYSTLFRIWLTLFLLGILLLVAIAAIATTGDAPKQLGAVCDDGSVVADPADCP